MTAAAEKAGSPMSRSILVVEDDAMVREVIRETLERSGFCTTVCRTGEEALSLARESCFDAIIIDHFLPRRTGTETTTDLRVHCPLSVIIGISGAHDGRHFREAGGDLFLSKPIDIIDMVRYLRERIP